uniref:uncharacterized protein n=1 Tax=Myxine glutinosa TaxID=7769 RepID=UPI00358F545B
MAKVTEPWSARQQRHLSDVSESTTDIQHVAGKDNAVADCLSRQLGRIPSLVASILSTRVGAQFLQDEANAPRVMSGGFDGTLGRAACGRRRLEGTGVEENLSVHIASCVCKNQDLSIMEHRTNPSGSRSGSDGGNLLGPGGSPGDEESVPDFIVKVKVECEIIDDYSTLFKDFIVPVKVESEFLDQSSALDKGEAQVEKSGIFQNYLLQTSQDALSNDHVKQEPCDSPPMEPIKATQLFEAEAQVVKSETFQNNLLQTSQDAVSNDHVKQELCDSPHMEPRKAIHLLEGKLDSQ